MANKIDEAIKYACLKHFGQTRKNSDLPYVVHPVECASIAATITNDLNVIIACILHDTLEDTDATPEEIEEKFGKRVLELVQGETEDKMEERSADETWKERKEKSLEILKNEKDMGPKVMWLSDKLSNMRSLFRTYIVDKRHVYDGFHMQDPKQQKWYYDTVAEYLKELDDTPAYKEYVFLKDIVFSEVCDE